MSDPLSTTFAALSDPTRRAILARLVLGETSVKEPRLHDRNRAESSRTGRHRRPFFDVSVLNAMSRVPLASGKIVHPIWNDVGVKQRPVASQIFLLHGLAGILK